MDGRPIVPVVMCGGSGSRLWPLSRETMPKQFLPLLGDLSTFQATMARVASCPAFGDPIVLAHRELRFIVAEQLRVIGAEATIVLEPERRDSAAALAVGALIAARRSPGALILALAADQVVADPDRFVSDCVAAAEIAAEGWILTLGMTAGEPSSAYGYILPGEAVGSGQGRRVASFVEKPGPEEAAAFVERNWLWNSGNFAFPAELMIEEIALYAPTVLAAAQAAVAAARIERDFLWLAAEPFGAAPSISIDHAVMERTRRAAVLPSACGWSDIGGWAGLWGASRRDGQGNAVHGPVELLDTRGSLIHAQDVLTTVIGVENVVVVSTRDAVLVASREHAARVREMVEVIKAKKRREATEHLLIHKPWGSYERIETGPDFQVKHIIVRPGAALSLQTHRHRSEHWVVVRGQAEVIVGDRVSLVGQNEWVYVPSGAVHRMANPGEEPLELIEVQVGAYLGEDDIVRLEDRYARN